MSIDVRLSEAEPMEGDQQLPLNDTYEVHPVADLFPMLDEDELAELAADIKQRGQLQPIVLDAEGRILDGRNRLVACRLADVEPRFDHYTGEDPAGFALAVNGQRREMTKAQRAVVAAKFSKLEKYGDQRKAARALGVTDSRVSEAKSITAYPDLTALVLEGKPFQAAFDEARKRDREALEVAAAKSRLRHSAADLLALVEDERMSLDEAIAALGARELKAAADVALAERAAKLPTDLAERVNAGTLDVAEAESVVGQRAERLKTWAEKIRIGLDTLTRMAGSPVPAELKEHLTDGEITNLSAVLGALENGERK